MNRDTGQSSRGASREDSKATVLSNKDSGRYCWVCFATEEEDRDAAWVHPCNCSGTTKWVHQTCLQRWVDEKQKGGNMGKVTCPQCQTEYIIVFPNMGILVVILDYVDNVIYKGSPFLAAGAVVGALYWCGVSYGAITMMQVLGQKEATAIMSQGDPLILLIGLPAIPVALFLSKLIRWEDAVLNFLRHNVRKIPVLRSIGLFQWESGTNPNPESSTENDVPPLSSPVSATRMLCSALMMPTISSFIGRLLFDSVKSNFHRTILGGLVFIAVKGCLKIYHKQQNYIRQCQRKILDYTESNISTFVRHTTRRRNEN